MCTSSFISRARSRVCAATRSVPQMMSSNKRPVYCLQSEQIIAAIGGWAENGALSGLCQYVGGFDEKCGRQCRTVRIEDDCRRHVRDANISCSVRSKQSPRAWQTRIDQADARRQGVVEKRFGPCGRESDVAGNRRMTPRQ